MTFTTFRQLHLRLLAILLCADCKSRISSIGSLLRGEVKGWCFYLFWSWRSKPVHTSSLSEPLTSNTCKSRRFRQKNTNNNLHISSIMSVSATVVWGVTKQNMWPLTSGPPALWALFDLWSSCSTENTQPCRNRPALCVWHHFLCFPEIFYSCQDTKPLVASLVKPTVQHCAKEFPLIRMNFIFIEKECQNAQSLASLILSGSL